MRADLFILVISAGIVGGRYGRYASAVTSKYCNSSMPQPFRIAGNKVTCTLDSQFVYNPSCSNWQIIAAIAFVNTPNPQEELVKIQKYLDEAGASCNIGSTLRVITPKWNGCTNGVAWEDPLPDNLLNDLIVNSQMTVANTSKHDYAIGDVMNSTLSCAQQQQLDSKTTTGIVYLFSDFNCSMVIDSQMDVLMTNMKQLLNLGYSVRLMVFGLIDIGCLQVLSCLNCTSEQCQISTIDETVQKTCRLSPTDAKFCNDSSSLKIKGNNVSCTLDPNQPNNESCSIFRIISAIVLTGKGAIKSQMTNITGYLTNAGADCENHSQLQIVTPQRPNCTQNSGWWLSQAPDLMKTLIYNASTAIPARGTEQYAIGSAMNASSWCTDQYTPKTKESGVMYLFTDFPCNPMLSSQVDILMVSIKQMLIDGYSVSILLLNVTHVDNECQEVLKCMNCTFPQCQIAVFDNTYPPTPNCRSFSGPQTSTKPPPTQTSTITPAPTPGPKSPSFTALDLALSIGIPCVGMVLCCGICAVCCIKCTKFRHRAMERIGLKKKMKGMHPGALHGGKSSSASDFNHFATGNDYMGLQQLAARNKKDYWELPPKNLVIHDGEILGTGAFSNVFKGTLIGKVPLLKAQSGISLNIENQKDSTCDTAVKRLPAHADDQSRIDFFHEIDFMKRLGYHVHIIAMLGCVSDPWDPLILVEYCHHGDMLKFLRNRRSHLLLGEQGEECPIDAEMCLRIKDLVSFAWQISDGLSYLSSKNFIHRDIAARNVLLTKNLVAKVSDFGLCRYIDSSLYTAKGGKLPIKWMAIESLKFYEYSVKTDVWAYGVCLFEIFSMGEGPYQAVQPLDMLKHLENGNRLERPEKCPTEIYDLMLRCWNAEADLRPTFNEIRGELTTLLNLDDEHYGYLSFDANNYSDYRTLAEHLQVVPEVEEFVDLKVPPALPPRSPTIQNIAVPPPRPEKLKHEKDKEKEEKRERKESKKLKEKQGRLEKHEKKEETKLHDKMEKSEKKKRKELERSSQTIVNDVTNTVTLRL